MQDENHEWKLGENEKITWRGKEIGRGMNGKDVFNGFFTLTEVIILAQDLSDELRKTDEQD